MKKITVTMLAFLLATSMTHASILNFGPRMGLNVSQLKVDQAKNKDAYEALNLKSGAGYHLGAFVRFGLGTIYIQPELLLSGSGARFTKLQKQKTQVRFTKIDVPAMAGISLLNIVRAQIGPTINVLLNAVEDGMSVKDYYSAATFGWQAGLGVDIWNLVVDLKYEGNLSKFGHRISKFEAKQGYGLWALSVGFNVF